MALWVVRAGDKGQQEEGVLKNNIVAIGWNKLRDLSQFNDFESLYKYYKEIYPREQHDKSTDYDRSVTLLCGEVWSFLRKINVEDLVVLPSKKSAEIFIGKIIGSYEYKKYADNIKHTRRVEWLKTIKKSDVPEEILNSFGTGLTVFNVEKNNAENYIQNLLGDSTIDKFEEGEKIIGEYLEQKTGKPYTGFDHPTLVEEVNYKLEIRDRSLKELQLDKWHEWKTSPGKIIDAVKKATRISGNLLSHQYGPKANSDSPLYQIDKTEEFEQILYDLFFGGPTDPVSIEPRLDKLINFVYENHTVRSWRFFSFLLFLLDSERYFPITPTKFNTALEFYGVKEKLSRQRKSWKKYQLVLDLVEELKSKLSTKYDPISNLQTQSYLWVLTGALETVDENPKTVQEIINFIENVMVMQENYQPVTIKTLVKNGGYALEDIVSDQLTNHNPDSNSKSMLDTVKKVLKSHGIITEEDDELFLNVKGELKDDDSRRIIEKCDEAINDFENQKDVSNETRYFIALGPWANWKHTLDNLPFRWGVNPSSASNVGVFNALQENDIVFFYANQDPPTPFSKRGLFGVGRVSRKYDEVNEQYWPDEKTSNKVIYKHRFEINPIKLVKTDSELLPWIDGLPFTKGLNRIANQEILEKLLQSTKTHWNIDLQNVSENYMLLRHNAQGSKWADDLGKIYHTGKIPNYTKLAPGVKTIWYYTEDGQYRFWGHGDISTIEEKNGEFFLKFDNFEFFNSDKTAKIGTDSIKQKIVNLPRFNQQISMFPITKEIYDEITNTEPILEKLNTFDDEKLPIPTLEDIKEGYAKVSEELLVPEEKIIEIVNALASRRHVLLAGPIGTGKTRLAKIIPEIFWHKIGGYFSEDHTATADWSTQDVIGGIFPKMEDGKPVYDIQNGCVVETVQKNWQYGTEGGKRIGSNFPKKNPPYRGTWLIIDEFNRADIDKAFGQLFTALRTRWLKIPTDVKGISYKNLKIPEDYRIIGTLNTADKHFLFQLSDALKSRFAYIEIDIPKKEQMETEIFYALKNAINDLQFDDSESLVVLDHQNKKVNKEKSNPEFYNRIYQAYNFLDSVRVFKKLGTAILKLIYQTMLVGTKMTGDSKTSLDNALISNLIPQIENLSQASIGTIEALHSDSIVKFFRDAYKNPNRQSYVDAFTKTLEYLKSSNVQRLVLEFSNGTLNVDDDGTWQSIQNAYENKKKEFELELNQLKQSMNDLVKSTVI